MADTTNTLRPTPSLADPEAVRERLQEWLNETLFAGKQLTLSEFVVPENGMSNITLMMDGEWQENGEPRKQAMVARLQPQGEKLAFPDYNLPMQYAAMRAVGQIPGIPVPTLIAQETTGTVLGMPFYIMQRTEGLIPTDMPPYHMAGWIVDSTPEEREHIWFTGVEVLSKLHLQPITQGPLQAFIAQHKPLRNIAEQLQYWEDYMHWGLEGARNLHSETALAWLKANMPSDEPQRLCWGDSRLANVILSEDKRHVAALLDWEMLTLGNPLQDIAWWIFADESFSLGLGIPRLEGFPSREETMRLWCVRTGFSAEHLHYYLVFVGMRFSLILARMSLATDKSMLAECFASQYTMKVLQEIN